MRDASELGASDRQPAPVVGRWEAADRWPWMTWLAALGGLGAVGLAALGLPPVDVHGPLHYVGVMDPLCGMTRAVRHLARGDVGIALSYNPAVPLLPAFETLALVRSVVGRATGRWLYLWVSPTRGTIAIAVVVLVALTAHQQAHVELIGP